MSLPTLWVDKRELAPRPVGTSRTCVAVPDSYFTEGLKPTPYDVPYVPASALEEATEALRLERAETARLRDMLLDARNALHGFDVSAGAITPDELPAQREAVANRISDVLFPRPGAKES